MNFSFDISYILTGASVLIAACFVLWLTVWTGKRYVSKEECKMSCNTLKENIDNVDVQVQEVKQDTQNFVSELHNKVDSRFNELSKEREKQEQRIQQMINELRTSTDNQLRDIIKSLSELKGGMDAHREILREFKR